MDSIKIRDLNLTLGDTNLLDNINFDIEGKKITGLIGNNGAGKLA